MAVSIGVLAEDRYLTQAQPLGLMAALAAREIPITLLRDADDAAGCDLVVARGRSEALLDHLAAVEATGVATLNRLEAIERVVDKSVMHGHLVDAGIPVPETWIGPFDDLRGQLQHDQRALIVKPVRGDNARDVYLASSGRALHSLWWQEPDAIVQRYLPNDGSDIKLYCAGDRVWTVRKPSPIHPQGGAPVLVRTTAEHRALARRCGAATGLDLYGVDCIATDDGLVVIEVNDFPNYSGIPDADDALAAHVVGAVLAHSGATTAGAA